MKYFRQLTNEQRAELGIAEPTTLDADNHAIRKNRVSGSEFAKLTGHVPIIWGTKFNVAQRLLDLAPPYETTEAQRHGTWSEGAILEFVKWSTGYEVKDAPTKVINDRCCATADGLILDKGPEPIGVLEMKTGAAWRWRDGVPDYYQIQCQAQMLAWDVPFALVAAQLYSERGVVYRLYEIKADPMVQRHLIDLVNDLFDNYIDKGVLPPPDASPACAEYLAEKFPKASTETLVASSDHSEIVENLRQVRDAKENILKEEAAIVNTLKNEMGEAAALIGDSFEITHRDVKGRRKIDYAAIVNDLGAPPSLVERHTTFSRPYRRFVTKFY